MSDSASDATIPPYVAANLDEEAVLADAPDGGADVPAGGAGADSGAVASARVDPADEAAVSNVSSANDTPGVGTRGADGEMERDAG